MPAVLAACQLANFAGAADAANSSILRSARGTLESRKLDSGAVTGSESWSMVVHPDRSRTLNTSNRIEAAGLQRNVVLSIDARFRPQTLFGPLSPVAREFLGVERIEVPAGRFEADHFRSGESEIWVHGPDANILRFLYPARATDLDAEVGGQRIGAANRSQPSQPTLPLGGATSSGIQPPKWGWKSAIRSNQRWMRQRQARDACRLRARCRSTWPASRPGSGAIAPALFSPGQRAIRRRRPEAAARRPPVI